MNNTTTTHQHSLTGAVAREHGNDLLRAAEASRIVAQLSGTRHWTPRRRPAWWLRITTRSVTPRTA